MTDDDTDTRIDGVDRPGGLPLGEVHTPTLDHWREDGGTHAGEGWVNWADPDGEVRVGVESVDLPVPAKDQVKYGFEVTLWAVASTEPDDVHVRETVHNSRLAVYLAEFLATHAEAFTDTWSEGPAPRPGKVDDSPTR